jgi:hypothetical protein
MHLLAAAVTCLWSQAAYAQVAEMDFLEGRWIIQDASRTAVGVSEVEIQAPGAMLLERRQVGDRPVQMLWFENSERNGGWTQLFLGPMGAVREFAPIGQSASWPLTLGANVVLQDGSMADFRMTLSRPSDDSTRRRLEISRDNGVTWQDVFDYYYIRDVDWEG